MLAQLSNLALWPLKKLLAYSLEYPVLLERGTQLLSRFPPLFNWIVRFAQAHGIVMAAEDPYPELDEINSVAELSPEALEIYESLKIAFQDRSRKPD
jgi:hypothetical protein